MEYVKKFYIHQSCKTCYFKDEECTILHREGAPAIEWSNGTKHWFLNGSKHRTDGPATEYFDGSKEWFINGKYHREDGPAIEYVEGTRNFYLNDKYYEEKDYWAIIKFGGFI